MAFIKIIEDESFKFKTNCGDILTFSKIRLIHGRTGYIDSNGNVRHIVGAFVDCDEIYSRWRVLNNNKNIKTGNE